MVWCTSCWNTVVSVLLRGKGDGLLVEGPDKAAVAVVGGVVAALAVVILMSLTGTLRPCSKAAWSVGCKPCALLLIECLLLGPCLGLGSGVQRGRPGLGMAPLVSLLHCRARHLCRRLPLGAPV
jgi:hypothetical protein